MPLAPSRLAFLLTITTFACGDSGSGDGGTTGSTGGDTSSSTMPPPSTMSDPTTPADSTSSTGEPASTSDDGVPATDSTGGSTSTGEPEASTSSSSTGEPGTSESSSSTDGGESSGSESESGGAVIEPFGDCVNLPPKTCAPGDVCIYDDDVVPAFGVCALPGCTTEADCPAVPATGTAPVACLDADGDAADECVLDCSAGQTCPDGMTCAGDAICSHGLVALACADETIAGPLPIVATGSTVGMGSEFTPNCSGGAESTDYALQVTVPETGLYVLSMIGSDFDTILSVYDDCGGPIIACNDDGATAVLCGGYPCSMLTLDLVAGQTILVVVDGYEVAGNYTLTIDIQGEVGNCCEYLDVPGCEDPQTEACVCALDNFCCKVVWDDICVDSAINDCNAFCPG